MKHVTARGGGRERLLAGLRRMRSPESGLLGQGMRFAVAGGTVALVYLSVTTVLAEVAGMAFQAALALGFCAGISVHFTLQRLFVWVHHEEFALPLHHQAVRYVLMAAMQYGLTAASAAFLPGALDVSAELVYVVTAPSLAAINFLVFRHRIFHAEDGVSDASPAKPGAKA